jgi:hypothetical protein
VLAVTPSADANGVIVVERHVVPLSGSPEEITSLPPLSWPASATGQVLAGGCVMLLMQAAVSPAHVTPPSLPEIAHADWTCAAVASLRSKSRVPRPAGCPPSAGNSAVMHSAAVVLVPPIPGHAVHKAIPAAVSAAVGVLGACGFPQTPASTTPESTTPPSPGHAALAGLHMNSVVT